MSDKVLFYHPLSQPARAAWSFCLANKLPVKFKFVDLSKGEHKTPEFLKVNPNGAIPSYSEGDFGLGESHTILRYLASDASVAGHWYPTDAKKRAKIDEYLDWHHSHTRKGVPFFFHKYVAQKLFGKTPNAERLEEGRKHYTAAIEYLEKNYLNSNAFLCGDEITLADLSAYAELGPLQKDADFKKVYEEHPKVQGWLKKMGEQEWHNEVMEFVFNLIESA